MTIKVYNDNGTITKHKIKKEDFINKSLEGTMGYVESKSKEKNALDIIEAYYSKAKVVLFDETNEILKNKLNSLNIKEFKTENKEKTIFDDKDFSLMFFTSGSTGNPVGALRTNDNLEKEMKVVKKFFKQRDIKKVIVTVPFIHIYGALYGLFYPLFNDIDIILKEHFLPNDLLSLIDENSLVVTTPLYIKALNKISEQKDLSKSLFVTSTAPLEKEHVNNFTKKFNTNIIQVFGSTETGGISYKTNDEELWTPFESVEIKTNEKNELKVKSPFVAKILYENEFKDINQTMQTFDYIEKKDEKFKLIGRSSKILKVAGKRYSTIQIENILEDIKEIKKALVFVNSNSKDALKGEILDITLESDKHFTTREIEKILKSKLSNLNFPILLKYVDKIPTSSVGKKLRIE